MKILVGISGGVDSAAAALKLLRDGHDVECAILKMHEYTDIDGGRNVAESLGLCLHEIDMQTRFNDVVKENLINEYLNGRTPNPCILCNEMVKFRGLYDFAMLHGFDAIATGHYSSVSKENGRYAVTVAKDIHKDQSYMLYRLPQEILSKLVLPLSEDVKNDVRSLARDAGISSADNKDSQEICFLPDNDYPKFIEKKRGYIPKGYFVDEDRNILGEHKGIYRYTVGQRKGLGIALGERVFVTKISPIDNTVTLSPKMIGVTEVELTDCVFSGVCQPLEPYVRTLNVKLRYSAPFMPVSASFVPDGKIFLHFDLPVTAAPGQSAVLYDGKKVVAGGYIN